MLGRWQASMLSLGEWSSILESSEDSLSSSYVRWQCTMLRKPEDGCTLGVAGPKDKFSSVKTWNDHGLQHRGVGTQTFTPTFISYIF